MEEVSFPLSLLREGQRARVFSMSLCGAMRRRVRELGLLPDAEVTCLRIAPAGTPTVYEVCGTAVALRRKDAAKVQVCLCEA